MPANSIRPHTYMLLMQRGGDNVRPKRAPVSFLVVPLLLSLGAYPANGQGLCDWEQCSLRLSHTPLQILQGAQGVPLGRGMFLGPNVEPLLAADDETGQLARRFRRYGYARLGVQLASMAGIGVSFRAFESNPEDKYLSSLIILALSVVTQRILNDRGLTDLERAIWLYNGRLDRSSGRDRHIGGVLPDAAGLRAPPWVDVNGTTPTVRRTACEVTPTGDSCTVTFKPHLRYQAAPGHACPLSPSR